VDCVSDLLDLLWEITALEVNMLETLHTVVTCGSAHVLVPLDDGLGVVQSLK
jgi:hypothetical protein